MIKSILSILIWIWTFLKACVQYPLRYSTGYRQLPQDLDGASSSDGGQSIRLRTPAERLLRSIERDTGAKRDHVPKFFNGTFHEAIRTAKNQFKLLLVFIHSGDHEKAEDFIKKVLFTEKMEDYVDENFVFYACDVSSEDGHKMSSRFQVTAYPFMGLLLCSGSTPQLVARFHGNMNMMMDLDALVAKMMQVVEQYEAPLANQRRLEEQRNAARLQREQQDREYQRTLEQDRLRQEEEERKRREAEEEQRRKEQQEREEQARLQSIKVLKKKTKSKVLSTPEPKQGEPDTCMIRFRFSDGSQIQRRFHKKSSTKEIFEFIWVLDEDFNSKWSCKPETSLNDLELTTNYPKTTLSMDQSIQESGAGGNTINVHELTE